jgi:hypothetical protein
MTKRVVSVQATITGNSGSIPLETPMHCEGAVM